MKRTTFSLLTFFALAMLLMSCDEGEDPKPAEEEPSITILGKWFFSETTSELISKQDNVEIELPNPNTSGWQWTFLENDSLLVLNQDTTFMVWYNYDTTMMRLEVDKGYYDVLNHDEDSLSIRFYANISIAEFYTYFT